VLRARDNSELQQAKIVWFQLTMPEQWAIAEEVVKSRYCELQRAYPDIVSIGYGYQTQGRSKRRKWIREVAVCFMVAKKWPKNSSLNKSNRALPEHLLAYCTLKNERKLCAVPTDIASGTDYKRIRPHGSSELIASRDTQGGMEGLIACVVKIPGDSSTYYAIGCLHVFAITQFYWPSYPPNASIWCLNSPNTVMGSLSNYRGILDSEPTISFDAALASITDRKALNLVAIKPRPNQFVRNSSQIPDSYNIWTQGGQITPATKSRIWVGKIPYCVPDPQNPGRTILITVIHSELVESQAITKLGDKRFIKDPVVKGTRRVNFSRMNDDGRKVVKPESDWIYTDVEPLISEDLWERCRQIVADRRQLPRPVAKKAVHLFAGVAYCICGNKMYVPSNTPKYVCQRCRNKIPIVDLEGVFHEQLKSFFLAPEEVSKYLSEADQTISDKQEVLDSIRQERQRLGLAMDRIYELYIGGQIAADGFGTRYKPLEERAKQLDDEIPRLQGEIDVFKINYLSQDQVVCSPKVALDISAVRMAKSFCSLMPRSFHSLVSSSRTAMPRTRFSIQSSG
jgi:hypothetical protein